ncbi:MAG: phosphotransferase [Trueperaceae bacterium]|nr:phosphotransferase [Trueperaceae bacterium]
MTDHAEQGAHLTEAARLHGVSAHDLTELGAYESDVYSFTSAHGPAILKVMAPGHRTTDQVQAEVDWLLALAEAAVPVALPVPAASGAWVEEVEPSGHLVVAFSRAPGGVSKPAEWTPELLELWGEVLGKLQVHTRGWTPPGPRRRVMIDSSHITALGEVAQDDPQFHAAASALLARVRPLIDGSGDSGLIHSDLHHGNLLLHEGGWTAIDFDDSAYASYAFDLAMPIYYSTRSLRDRSLSEAAEFYIPPFMRGFRRHAPDPVASVEDLEAIMRFRRAEEALAINYRFAQDKITPALRAYGTDLRDRVVSGAEFMPLDVLAQTLA